MTTLNNCSSDEEPETAALIQTSPSQGDFSGRQDEELYRLKLYWTKLHLSLDQIVTSLKKREAELISEKETKLLALQPERQAPQSLNLKQKIANRQQKNPAQDRALFTKDAKWAKWNSQKLVLEAQIDIIKRVQQKTKSFNFQTSQLIRSEIDNSMPGQLLKSWIEKVDQLRAAQKDKQLKSTSLKQKIARSNILNASANKKQITIADIKRENPAQVFSMDYFIKSVLDQQEDAYGYVSIIEKHKKEFEKELKIFDWLDSTSWSSLRKQADRDEKEIEEFRAQNAASQMRKSRVVQYRSLGSFHKPFHKSQNTSRMEARRRPITMQDNERRAATQQRFHRNSLKNTHQKSEVFSDTRNLQSSIAAKESQSQMAYNNLQSQIESYCEEEPHPILLQIEREDEAEKQKTRQRVRQKVKKQLAMQLKLRNCKSQDPGAGIDSEAKDDRDRRELDKISQVCNRYVQAHDPYIMGRFECFERKRQRTASLQSSGSKALQRNARSQSELITDFLDKRGLSYGEAPPRYPLTKLIPGKSWNSSSRCVPNKDLIERMQLRGNVQIIKDLRKPARIQQYN